MNVGWDCIGVPARGHGILFIVVVVVVVVAKCCTGILEEWVGGENW
jgi:hypothetical protein